MLLNLSDSRNILIIHFVLLLKERTLGSIGHVMRIRILHVNKMYLVQRRTTVHEYGGAEVDIILS